MKHTTLLLALLAVAHASFAIDESIEPELKYKLLINGEEHRISTTASTKIKGSYTDPEVRISAENYRLFNYGGIQFQYPASMSWAADITSKQDRSWSLDGNDTVIAYYISPHELSLDEWGETLAEQFGKERVRITQMKLKLGDTELDGKNLFIKMAGVDLTIEVFTLPSETGSRLLTVQDSPPKERARSQECEGVIKMLTQTFKITE